MSPKDEDTDTDTGLGQGDRKQIDKMQTLFLVVFGAAVPVSRLQMRRQSPNLSTYIDSG